MRSPSFIIETRSRLLAVVAIGLMFVTSAAARPKVAFLTPDKTEQSKAFAEALSDNLRSSFSVIDADLAASAYGSNTPATPFNLTTEESRRIGAAIGCDFFVITKAFTQRRNDFKKKDYYEAYAPIYLVSSRTGRRIYWDLQKFESALQADAEKQLMNVVGTLAAELISRIERVSSTEIKEQPPAQMEEPPDPTSPLAKNFKAPIPFRRIKPEYTAIASFYEIAATVDVMVDLDAQGTILRTEIVRWAGYGLDESVEAAVRQMNWRAAERNGRPLPMRFLLRYNFKKVDKD